MQLSNTPGKLLLPFAAAGGKNTIPVDSQIGIVAGKASLADGFPPLTRTPLSAGGVPPSGLDMNGILYEMSAVIRWANAGGGYAYDGTFAADSNVGGYPKGARVMRSDGVGYWFNTVENNMTDPEAAGAAAAGWLPDFTSGATAVTMTNANVTLTPLQYGKPVIVISGLLTANLNLIFPSIAGEWSVINNTTGAFTITCKTATGNGVAVSSSDILTCDGLNFHSSRSGLGRVVDSIAALRALPKAGSSRVFVIGYYAAGDGGGGPYRYDSTDTTSADNGGTIIVASDGGRWKLVNNGTISVKQFGAKGDGTTNDYAAIQATINSGIRRIYVPSARYSCLSTLNLCNLATTGVPLHIFGDATDYDNGTLTAGSVILSNPGATNWVAEIIGSQFVTIEDLMFISTGTNSAKGGLIYARSSLANFAQNNSLRRVIIKIATTGASVALANNCAEQFVCDECWLEADIPYITTLANEMGWTAVNATIANITFSNTAQSFRLTTFTPLTSTGMILTGLGTAFFDNCIVIPKAGNTYQYGVTIRSSVQAYQDCQNIKFTGQIESWVNAVRLEGNTRDVKFDFSTSSVTGAHVLALANTVHYSPDIRTNAFNTTGVNVFAATGATVTVYGGCIVIAPNLKFVDSNVKLLGTDVDGGNGNMASAAFFAVNQLSSYHARWSNSKLYGSSVWNPGTIATGTATATTFGITGAAVGDLVNVFFPYASQGLIAQGSVDSANVVRILLLNMTGSPITPGSGTWKVTVERPTF